VRKAAVSPLTLRMIEEEFKPIPSKGWTARIIDHLKLTFVAEKPSPSRVLTEVALMAAEQRMEYFL
jgi:hypothetical protein